MSDVDKCWYLTLCQMHLTEVDLETPVKKTVQFGSIQAFKNTAATEFQSFILKLPSFRLNLAVKITAYTKRFALSNQMRNLPDIC